MGGQGYTPVKETTSVQVEPGVYDLERDALPISIMEMAVERGAEHITLFVNSPPAYMTLSGQTNGTEDGSSNLNPAYTEEFVDYVVDITELLVEKGLPIDYVSPINEPQILWGSKSTYSQEGCHYDPELGLDVLKRVARELQAREIPVKVSFPETASWVGKDWTYDMVDAVAADAELAGFVDHFSGHSYGTDAAMKKSLRQYIAQKGLDLPIRQTEWCSDKQAGSGAVELSRVIHEDLTSLNAVSWDFWVAMMTDAWSLIQVQGGRAIEVSTRLYALGNYSKFITGYTRVDCLTVNEGDSENIFASAYISPDGKQTAVIVTNAALSNQTFSFKGDAWQGRTAKMYLTSVSEDLEYQGDISTDYGVELPFQSVATFVFDNP